MTSQEFEKRELPRICRQARIICNSVQSVEMTYTLFVDISRVHIQRHGKTLLWPKWTDSAERAAVWTSGYPSSTCLNDELLAVKACKRTVICAGSVVCTLMDTLPSRDQIPKHCWQGKKQFGGEKKKATPLSAWDAFKREDGFPLQTGLFGAVSLGNQDEMPRSLYLHELGIQKKEKEKKSLCVCFFMWSRTLYRRIVSCMCGKASVTRSGEKPENRAVELDQGLCLSLQKQSTCWNTGPFAISLISFKLLMLTLLLS